MLVRIVPLSVTRAPSFRGPKHATTRLTQGAFLGLAKTCAKLSLSFWDYLGARLGITGQVAIPYLPDLVRARCQPA